MRSSAVGLAQQCFDGREVARRRVHVDDVVQIVIGVDITALQLKAAVVARLPVRIHAIDRSEQPRHCPPGFERLWDFARFERVGVEVGIDHQARQFPRWNVEVRGFGFAVDALGRLSRQADVRQRRGVGAAHEDPGMKMARRLEKYRLILRAHIERIYPIAGNAASSLGAAESEYR